MSPTAPFSQVRSVAKCSGVRGPEESFVGRIPFRPPKTALEPGVTVSGRLTHSQQLRDKRLEPLSGPANICGPLGWEGREDGHATEEHHCNRCLRLPPSPALRSVAKRNGARVPERESCGENPKASQECSGLRSHQFGPVDSSSTTPWQGLGAA